MRRVAKETRHETHQPAQQHRATRLFEPQAAGDEQWIPEPRDRPEHAGTHERERGVTQNDRVHDRQRDCRGECRVRDRSRARSPPSISAVSAIRRQSKRPPVRRHRQRERHERRHRDRNRLERQTRLRVIRDPDGALRPQRTRRTLRKLRCGRRWRRERSCSLVVSGSIAAGTFVLGSSSGGWVHDYLYPFQFDRSPIFAIVFACCAVLAMVPLAEVNRRQWRMLAMWFALGLCAQGMLRGLSPYTMDGLLSGRRLERFLSTHAFNTAASNCCATSIGSGRRCRLHPSTNMPGKVILMDALGLVSQRPLVLGVARGRRLRISARCSCICSSRDWLDDRETALAVRDPVFVRAVEAAVLSRAQRGYTRCSCWRARGCGCGCSNRAASSTAWRWARSRTAPCSTSRRRRSWACCSSS